ncbi:MAG: ExbD/TolR family protein [Thermoanaerobaculia bacterium]
MGMAAGGIGDYKSDINITPLVDVVLVLLIIFMVITPLLQMGYEVKVPPKAQVDNPAINPDQLIVSLTPQNRIFLNKQELTAPQLVTQLSTILKNRRDKTVFFSGDDSATYGDVARVMDLCRNAGATNLGIVLETVPIQ